MMMGQLKNWQHALLSFGILVLGLFALYIVLISPVLSSRDCFNERFADLELQYSKYKKAEQQLQQLQRQLTKLNQGSPGGKYFLDEKSPSLAGADLQKHIKAIIESHEGNLVSTQPIDDKGHEIFAKVTIRIHMRGNINALHQILYQLESSTPQLFIDNMTIQNRIRAMSRGRQQNAKQLDIRFDVTGYIFDPSV